ncbi:MAG: phosphoribosylanthranilate isomerase [Clostridiales bacterium]|nr:phosphoribosylanthranilate isomerase [Clostridiales bacterium]
MSKTKIKICGLFRHKDIDFVNAARPDYAGFVFARRSRRFVEYGFAEELSRRLAPGIIPVGVFAGADAGEIAELFYRGVIKAAQLHGGEDENYAAKLKKACAGLTVIRAVSADGIKGGTECADCAKNGINGGINGIEKHTNGNQSNGIKGIEKHTNGNINDGIKGIEKRINRDIKSGVKDTEKHTNDNINDGIKYGEKIEIIRRGSSDFLLVDNGNGGTGKPFDWHKIRGIEPPFFLAGGIDKNNIFDALKLSPYAVDISGGAETDGFKDSEKIMFLTKAAREYTDG